MSLKISEIETPRFQGAPVAANPKPSLLSLTLIGAGGAILVWTALDLLFRTNAADFNGKFCLPLAIGIAVIAWGSLLETKWKSFAAWSSLALVGQAASLQMIDAGRLIHFQHYRSIPELLQTDALALTFLILQIICVGIGISAHARTVKGWLTAQLAKWQIALLAILVALSAAAVTPDVYVYSTSLAIGAVVQLVSIANVILLAWSVPDDSMSNLRDWINRFLEGNEREQVIRLDRFSLIAALSVVLLTASLSYFVYQAHPHVPDETQYIFQANYMAAGQLTVAAPAVPEAFSMYMVPFRDNRWPGIFPPGWPALLAVGTLLGLSWLVNPLLAGLCTLLAYIFFQQIYSRRFARMAVLLLCCSPWMLFMGMSYMSHVSTLVFALAAAVLLMRGIRTEKTIYSLGAGLAIGAVFLIRPLDGAIVLFILGIGGFFGNRTWKPRIIASAGLIIGTAISASIVFPYNKLVTGSALLSPSDAYYDAYVGPKVMALGFGPERGMHWPLDAFPGHSPIEAAVNAALNVFQLNTELFGWGTGSLIIVAFLFVSGRWSRKDFWAWGSIAVIVGAYSLFWYHGGPDFGARYWFLSIIPLIAITVKGLDLLGVLINGFNGDGSRHSARVILAAGVLCIMSLTAYLPWRASDKYFAYLGAQPGILRLSREHNFGKSLVLVRGGEHPDYQSAWIYNPLDFEGDAPIFAQEKDPETRSKLLRVYSDRRVWMVDGPTVANGEYRIRQGPLDPTAALSDIK